MTQTETVTSGNPKNRGNGPFPRTRWSLVVQAQGEGTFTSGGRTMTVANALEALCKAYWAPLFAYARKVGFDKEDAEDVTQEFIAWFIERDHLADADPSKGKLRSYLLAHLRRFAADKRKFMNAGKRGGGKLVHLDQEQQDRAEERLLAGDLSPEEVFDARWARSIMERSLERLREEYFSRGKGSVFEALSPFLQSRPEDTDYQDSAASLGISVPAVKMNVMRMRKRLAILFREEVLTTIGDEDQLDQEISHLMSLFGR